MTQTQAERPIEDGRADRRQRRPGGQRDVAKGRVISQDPDPDQTSTRRQPVDLVVSTGKPEVQVPYVVGDDKEDARPTARATPGCG